MGRFKGDRKYKPISTIGYVGYTALFAIPVVGLIFLVIFAVNGDNVSRRSYARSYFVWMLLAALLIFGLTRVDFSVGYGKKAAEITVTVIDIADEKIGPLKDFFTDIADRIRVGADAAPAKPAETVQVAGETEMSESAGKTAQPDDADSIAKEFKDTMDSYEKFFGEYVLFMETYDAGNTKMLSRYTTLVTQYDDSMKQLEAIGNAKLTPAELRYYDEVMARINQKIADFEKN